MDKSVLYPTEDGTPQGGIISPRIGKSKALLHRWARVLQHFSPVATAHWMQ
jgi:hypothetical protein